MLFSPRFVVLLLSVCSAMSSGSAPSIKNAASEPIKALPYAPQEGAPAIGSANDRDGSVIGSVTLDHLGPIVVGTDGTMQRIANWDAMTEAERSTTMRVVAKRNAQRLAKLNADLEAEGRASGTAEEEALSATKASVPHNARTQGSEDNAKSHSEL